MEGDEERLYQQEIERARLRDCYQQILTAYKAIFGGDNSLGNLILLDLWAVIRPDDPQIVIVDDPFGRLHCRNEGRREMWIHIMKRLRQNIEHVNQVVEQVEIGEIR